MCEAAAEAAAAVGRRAAFAAGRQLRFLLLPFLRATLLYLSPNAFCAQVLRDAGDNVVDSSASVQVSDCCIASATGNPVVTPGLQIAEAALDELLRLKVRCATTMI